MIIQDHKELNHKMKKQKVNQAIKPRPMKKKRKNQTLNNPIHNSSSKIIQELVHKPSHITMVRQGSPQTIALIIMGRMFSMTIFQIKLMKYSEIKDSLLN